MNMLNHLACLLIFTVVGLAAAPDKTRQLLTTAKEPVRIVCIGDSITGVYYHSGSVRAYPEMLQIALRKIHPKTKITVRNAGISGDTCSNGPGVRSEYRRILKRCFDFTFFNLASTATVVP